MIEKLENIIDNRGGIGLRILTEKINEVIDVVNYYEEEVEKGNDDRGMPPKTVIVKGKSLYDPRDGRYKYSDNPALILYDFIKSNFNIKEPEDTVLKQIADLADVCDDRGFTLNTVSKMG